MLIDDFGNFIVDIGYFGYFGFPSGLSNARVIWPEKVIVSLLSSSFALPGQVLVVLLIKF